MTNIFYTFVLRCCQAGLDASLTLLLGVIIAAIFRRMLGPAAIRRLFGHGFVGSLRAWGAGMLLPVCSLGVIPVAKEMRRAGVAGGVVLAFVLTAPLLNPISFLYGITLGEPKVILTFAAITLAKTALVAYLWDAWFGGARDTALAVERARIADSQPMPAAGQKRIFSVFVTTAKELSSGDVVYYAIGLLGNGVMAACVPYGVLRHTLFHHDKMAPLRMLFLSIPAYISPLSGMMRIGSMFDHGNSIGAAFILLVLGVGVCLGTLWWMIRDFGKKIVPWFAMYALIVLGLAYVCEPLLWNPSKQEENHTHAFDDLSSPFRNPAEMTSRAMRHIVGQQLSDQFQLAQQLSVGCLLVLAAAGIALRLFDPADKLEARLVAVHQENRTIGWNPTLSGRLSGGLIITGLVAFSVIGAYVYYPNREFCLEEMRAISADTRETVRQGFVDESIRHLQQWDLVARQLQVGVYIRSFGVTSEQAKAVDDLREAIEDVRDDLRARKLDKARQKLDEVVFAGEYRACVQCYTSKANVLPAR